MDRIKSIAVPVTRRGAVAKAQRANQSTPPTADADEAVLDRETRRVTPPITNRSVHRYRVGQRLALSRGSISFSRQTAACRVIALMPHETGPLYYRILSDAENFERVVDEMDLSPLP